jgi:hypothetical protein
MAHPLPIVLVFYRIRIKFRKKSSFHHSLFKIPNSMFFTFTYHYLLFITCLLCVILTKCGKNEYIKRNFKNKNLKFTCVFHSSVMCGAVLSQSCVIVRCIETLCDVLSVSLLLILWKSASPKAECPQSKVKVMVILQSPKGHVMCLIWVTKWKF